jgi:hypothetical protein
MRFGLMLVFVCGLLLVWVRPANTPPSRHTTSAIASIRTLHSAEVQYYSQSGRYGELRDLGQNGANLIARDLAIGLTVGYRFTVKLSTTGYVVVALPIDNQGASFYSDETMIIRQGTPTRPASASSPQLK